MNIILAIFRWISALNSIRRFLDFIRKFSKNKGKK